MYRREKMVARIWLKNKNKKIGRKKRTKKKKSKWNGEEKTCIWVCFCTVHSFQKYLNILKVLCILWYVRNRVIMNTNALYVHEHLSALSKTLSNSKWKTGALFISLFFSRIIFPFPFLLFFFFTASFMIYYCLWTVIFNFIRAQMLQVMTCIMLFYINLSSNISSKIYSISVA